MRNEMTQEYILNYLTKEMSNNTGEAIEDILSKCQRSELTDIRKAIAYSILNCTAIKISKSSLARYFNQSHCTIIKNMYKAQEFIDSKDMLFINLVNISTTALTNVLSQISNTKPV